MIFMGTPILGNLHMAHVDLEIGDTPRDLRVPYFWITCRFGYGLKLAGLTQDPGFIDGPLLTILSYTKLHMFFLWPVYAVIKSYSTPLQSLCLKFSCLRCCLCCFFQVVLNLKWATHVFKAVERATSRTVRRLRASFAIWISLLTGAPGRIAKASCATLRSSVCCFLPCSTLALVRDLVTLIPATSPCLLASFLHVF